MHAPLRCVDSPDSRGNGPSGIRSAGRLPAALRLLLTDSEWWVRYRTAKALCALPGVDMAHIHKLSTEHHDPFARDMLVHVLAEAHA